MMHDALRGGVFAALYAARQGDRALEDEVARRKAELARTDDRMRFALKAGRIGSWTLDLADRRLEASDICKENFGRSAGEPFPYEDIPVLTASFAAGVALAEEGITVTAGVASVESSNVIA